MEYVPETLYKVLKHYSNSYQKMPLIYVKPYTDQIFRGLACIHTVPGVCHRDVKPQNLLVDPLTHQVKLCEFGSSKFHVIVRKNSGIVSCSSEQSNFSSAYFLVWLAGCVLAELLLGQVFHKRMPPEAIDLASRLLQYSPSLRCTALEACAHPFFDEHREPHARLPNGWPFPPLFNFKQELNGASPELINWLIPEHVRRKMCLFMQPTT